jgi:hypothetical protein
MSAISSLRQPSMNMYESSTSSFEEFFALKDKLFDIPHSGYTVRVRQPSEYSLPPSGMIYTPCPKPGISIDSLIDKAQNDDEYQDLFDEFINCDLENELTSLRSVSEASIDQTDQPPRFSDVQRNQYPLLTSIAEGLEPMPVLDDFVIVPFTLATADAQFFTSDTTLYNPHEEGKQRKKNKIKYVGKLSTAFVKVKTFFGKLKPTKFWKRSTVASC